MFSVASFPYGMPVAVPMAENWIVADTAGRGETDNKKYFRRVNKTRMTTDASKQINAEGRASAIILSSLPIAMFIIIQIVAPDFYASVWDESMTKTALALAGCWMGIGNFIMYRLVNFKI